MLYFFMGFFEVFGIPRIVLFIAFYDDPILTVDLRTLGVLWSLGVRK